MGERADVHQRLREVGERAELDQGERERERGPGGRGAAREHAEEREREAREYPGGGGLEQRGAEQARDLAGVARLGGVADSGRQAAAASRSAVPPNAIEAWLSAQRVRLRAVASSGSARPLVSSARRRSVAWIA